MIRAKAAIGSGTFSLEVKGHAEADDVTCAAITALQQTLLLYLEQITALRPDQIQLEIQLMEAEQ